MVIVNIFMNYDQETVVTTWDNKVCALDNLENVGFTISLYLQLI